MFFSTADCQVASEFRARSFLEEGLFCEYAGNKGETKLLEIAYQIKSFYIYRL